MSIGHLYVLFGEVSIQILCSFLIGLFIFLVLTYISSLYTLNINPLLDVLLVNMFSHSVGCLFMLRVSSFAVQKLFSLMLSHLFIFSFVSPAGGDISEKIIAKRNGRDFTAYVFF